MKLVLDVRKSVEANAAVYFEKAKKAKKKLAGAKLALERSQQRLQQLVLEKEAAGKRIAAAAEDKEKIAARALQKAWYEKFRWFISSEGLLCIGGRDATTNEIIMKKHAEKDDIVFHTELAGSPFFVVKNQSSNGGSGRGNNSSDEKEENATKTAKTEENAATTIGEKTIEEAAIATASYSKAWKAGLQSVDVYWVRPEQVSKEAKAGEYLVKGAFMIYGKKNYVPAKIELAIGVTAEGKVMGGPAAAVAKNCAKSVKMLQGDNKSSDAAKKIVKILGLSNGSSYLDEIIRAMPAGECKVVA